MTRAAQATGVSSRRTLLTRWSGWYRQGGLAEVLEERVPGHGATGSECRPSEHQRGRLLERASLLGEFRTYEEAGRWVEQEWGVRYRYTRGCTRCWRGWGCARRCAQEARRREGRPRGARRGPEKGGLLGALSGAGLDSGRGAWHSEEMRLWAS